MGLPLLESSLQRQKDRGLAGECENGSASKQYPKNLGIQGKEHIYLTFFFQYNNWILALSFYVLYKKQRSGGLRKILIILFEILTSKLKKVILSCFLTFWIPYIILTVVVDLISSGRRENVAIH